MSLYTIFFASIGHADTLWFVVWSRDCHNLQLLFIIIIIITRGVPKVMSKFFLHANWEQQTKESAVVDGTSCCVILECLVTSIACIT